MGAVREYDVMSHYSIADKGYKTPCWLWNGPLNYSGYAITNRPGRNSRIRIHRLYYEKYVGAIPNGLVLDHLCSIRHCVNPEHLEPVTQAVNRHRTSRSYKFQHARMKVEDTI